MPLGHGHGHRRLSLTSNRSSADETRSDSVGGEDETIVEPDQGNGNGWADGIWPRHSPLTHHLAVAARRRLEQGSATNIHTGASVDAGENYKASLQYAYSPGAVQLLTLVGDISFMAHPETLLPMPEIDDPIQRFVSVVKFYLSGWHIRPPGVKKPLNPILGETFTCYWEYPDHTRGYYISEQTSHHPPKSSYFFMAPEHNIRIDGTLKPRSKFLGNSAASLMEGIAILRLTNRGKSRGGEKYILTQPNMYARGILFGKMKYELGDHSVVRCPEHGLVADVEFKTKGYFGGTYNAIGGAIRNEKSGEVLFELSGMWSGEMYAKNVATGQKELLFNATNAKHTPPLVRPLEEQDERESQKLWYQTVAALKERNHDAATDEKTRIEDMQREEAARRVESGVEWQPRLFRRVRGGPGGPEEGEEDLDYILNADIDGPSPEAKIQQILAIAPILRGQRPDQQSPNPPQQHTQAQPQVQQAQAPPQQAQNHQTYPSLQQAQAPPQHIQAAPMDAQFQQVQAEPQEMNPQLHQAATQIPQGAAHAQQVPPLAHRTAASDLIDFGQEPQGNAVPAPAPIQQQPMATHDLPAGLQEPLEPALGPPVVRLDTKTEDIDVFVDAPDQKH